ncbi:MAG: HTH domain-containing protein [Firmicutes bacterium]|nr:HTH domain-containing protein [Bacillota bacterium]
MKVFEQIQQLQRIHQLIAAEQTGSPKEFAQKLGISPSRLYNILDELKSRGIPISYSRSAKKYFYNKDFQLDISCYFQNLH